ncbi:MAG: DUF2135 domain-containing protein [Proteobacteria bacterium]|nr:DUF2135 domain-containing protein [Pseudomonadota bacterium]
MFPRLFVSIASILLAAAASASAQVIAPPLPPQPSHPPRLIETVGADRPVQLQSLRISSEISGSMAETTVKMVFFNPNQRQLEGQLQFPLLDGQQISAFALDIEGNLRSAVPVEKARGRQIFEAIERRQVDPGLLEQTQGNNFKLRIYPIPAQGTRTVELTYTEAMKRDRKFWAYRLPLAYGEHLQDFDLSLQIRGSSGVPQASGALGEVQLRREAHGYVARVTKNRYAPHGALTILIPTAQQEISYVQEHDGDTYFVTEIPVAIKRSPRALPKVVGLLWDSSGSGAARAREAELVELDRYFKALGNAEVRLTRLHDRAEKTGTFRVVNGKWDALRASLAATVYDGASALADWQPQADVGEYLLVSDGLSNYGANRFPQLAAGQRLYALNSALSADTGRLAALAERSGGRLVQVRADKPGAAAAALLTEGTHVRNINANGATAVLVDTDDASQGVLRVAGKLLQREARLTLTIVEQGKQREMTVAVSANNPRHPLAAHVWAGYQLHALEADYEFNRAAIRRLGTAFAMPTRETSLIVLERLDDYVRYDVTPPSALADAVAVLKKTRGIVLQKQRSAHVERIAREFEQKVAWWEKRYPKDEPPKKKDARNDESRPMAMPTPASVAASRSAQSPREAERASNVSGLKALAKTASSDSDGAPEIGIALKKWTSDAPYIARMNAASADDIYKIYLDEKLSWANSSAFYLDAADMLLEKGQRDLALRVLSNLAEMDLENRHVLRILGYRLLQADAPELAIPIFEKVQYLAEEEPQSFRDLGLAFAAAKHDQKAVDQLYEVVARPWDGRFAEIELIALAEMNAIIANAPTPLDTSRIDPRFLKNMPLDVRAVLTWDADNSDMDLWVTDPNGEKCYYGHRFTYQGGRMSRDFTGGYGPEEFSLRDAKPGKYRIEANFFGSRQQVVAGATTLQVRLTSGFGSKAAKDQMITLRLKGRGATEFVGEFEVKANEMKAK